MERTLSLLQSHFPDLSYKESDIFCWSPETKEIFYSTKAPQKTSQWSLLHETSHALLGHSFYRTDFELLRLEVEAWYKAKSLAREFHIAIDDNHIQDCLDTYRDWLYARSICPHCNNKSLQQAELKNYKCFNCHTEWQVTPSRFCRPYRLQSPQRFTSVSGQR